MLKVTQHVLSSEFKYRRPVFVSDLVSVELNKKGKYFQVAPSSGMNS